MNVYKRRLKATNSSDALVKTSITQVKEMFKDSPLYKVITIDGITTDARVNLEDDENSHLLLPPQSSTNKGAIAEFDSVKWMVMDYKPDVVYPKAQVKLCNQVVKWIDGSGVTHEYPCVATGKGYQLDENGEYLVTSDGKVVALIPYNSVTQGIEEKQRFVFGDRSYEVIGVDDVSNVVNGKGYIEVTVEVTSTASTDDTVNKVADNNNNDSGWGGAW